METLQPLIRKLVMLFDREGFSSEFHVTDFNGANQQVGGNFQSSDVETYDLFEFYDVNPHRGLMNPHSVISRKMPVQETDDIDDLKMPDIIIFDSRLENLDTSSRWDRYGSPIEMLESELAPDGIIIRSDIDMDLSESFSLISDKKIQLTNGDHPWYDFWKPKETETTKQQFA
ncbi:MAG: hypothetical protein ACPHS8_03870 [Candidatus Poseidoniaceae archaeon]